MLNGVNKTTRLGRQTKTNRGFPIVRFKDCYGTPCSLQASSLAEREPPGTSAVWLGPEEASPKILAVLAAAHGIMTGEITGWVNYPLPETVLCTTRAHLNRKQVAALIRHLERWLKTGNF